MTGHQSNYNMKITVLMPALNEEESIGKTSEGISSVPAFRKYPIVSDNGYVNLE